MIGVRHTSGNVTTSPRLTEEEAATLADIMPATTIFFQIDQKDIS